MAAEANLTTKDKLGTAIAIDFVSQFEYNLNRLVESLGITDKMPIKAGSLIKQYGYKVTPAAGDGVVAEGDIIPLTEVSRELKRTIELNFKKFRKSTSIEAIQAHGYEVAVTQTDRELIRHAQREVRSQFFAFLKEATEDSVNRVDNAVIAEQPTLQAAIAYGNAAVQDVLDMDLTPVVMANPFDVADHMADGTINSNGAVFGLNLLSNYVGANILTNKDVPKGTIYVTAAENLKLAYADPNGDIGKAFNFVTDETGYIGIKHSSQDDRLTEDTVLASAVTLFPDVLDAVVAVKIVEPVPVP